MSILTAVRGWLRRCRQDNEPRPLCKPRLESLEELVLPCTITWNGASSGAWETASNWSPARVPNATDEVCISAASSVTISLATATTVQSLQMTSGRLRATTALTVTGGMTWTGGTLGGQGQTTVEGGITFSGSTSKYLEENRTLENRGLGVWTGDGEITLSNGAFLVNAAGATLEARSNTYLSAGGGPAPAFVNDGTFVKLTGTGESGIEVPFTNGKTGALEVRTGTLYLSARAQLYGSISVPAGAALHFDFGQHLLQPDASLSGAGTVIFGGGTSTIQGTYNVAGTTRISGGTVLFDRDATAASVSLTSGVLAGTVGTLGVTQSFTWSGGVQRGTGVTRIESPATLTISGDNDKTFEQRTLTNRGTATWTGLGSIEASNGARVVNDGTFTASSDAVFVGSGAAPVFQNNLTFRRSGAGTTNFSIGAVFNSSDTATVEVLQGRLTVGNGTMEGVVDVLNGGTLTFASGTHTLTTTSRVFGLGMLVFDGANVTVEGQYEGPNETRVNGGRVAFEGKNPTLVNGLLLGGTITGSSDLTIAPNIQFGWNGGTITGTGGTLVAKGATFAVGGAFVKTLTGRPVTNQGTVTWTSIVAANDGVVWDNQEGSRVEASNGGLDYGDRGDGPTFLVAGEFLKLSGAIFTFGAGTLFTNTGYVEVQPGRLSILGAFTNFASQTLSGGSFFIAGTLQFQNADVRTNESIVTLSGAPSAIVNQSNGNGLASFRTNLGFFQLENNRDLTVAAFTNAGVLGAQDLSVFTASGLFSWTAGTLFGSGTLEARGGLELNSKEFLTLTSLTVNLFATSTWTAGDLLASEGALVTILLNATLNIPIDANGFHGGGNAVLIVNRGTVRKTTGTGLATLGEGIGFTNEGTVQVNAGILALLGGLTNFDAETGLLAGGTYTLSGGLQFAGAAIVTNQAVITLNGPDAAVWDEAFNNGFRTLAANAAAGQLTLQNGATLTSNAATLTNSGQITLTGAGTLFTATVDVFTNAATGRLTLQSGAGFTSSAATLTNNGQITLMGAGTAFAATGDFSTGGNGSALTINANTAFSAATFRLTSSNATLTNGTLTADTVTVQGGTLNDSGTINGNSTVTGGTLSVPGTINGSVTVQGGTLSASASGTINGSVTLLSGTITTSATIHGDVTVTNGTMTNSGRINGPVSILGGTFTTSATATINGDVTLTSGTMNGSGTINGNVLVQGGRINIGGNTTGTLTINGDWTQEDGILQIQIRDEDSYDRLVVAGTANLGGRLEVRMLNNFDPPLEAAFDILSAGFVDEKDVFEEYDFPEGIDFQTDYSNVGLTLVRRK